MNVTGLTFYPLQNDVMNVSEPMKHLLTSHGHTLLSFLPIQLWHAYDCTYAEDNSLERLHKLKNIHHCIIQTMKPLVGTALSGIQNSTSDQERLSLQVVIGS